MCLAHHRGGYTSTARLGDEVGRLGGRRAEPQTATKDEIKFLAPPILSHGSHPIIRTGQSVNLIL